MYGPNTFATATDTATLDSGSGVLLSVGLCGGSDAATAVIRTGGSSGTVICKLGVAAGVSTQRTFMGGVPYRDLHVTITGTTPQLDAELAQGG